MTTRVRRAVNPLLELPGSLTPVLPILSIPLESTPATTSSPRRMTTWHQILWTAIPSSSALRTALAATTPESNRARRASRSTTKRTGKEKDPVAHLYTLNHFVHALSGATTRTRLTPVTTERRNHPCFSTNSPNYFHKFDVLVRNIISNPISECILQRTWVLKLRIEITQYLISPFLAFVPTQHEMK